MPWIRTTRALLIALSCLNLIVPGPLWAGDVTPLPRSAPLPALLIRDVALGAGGRLSGQIVGVSGQPLRNAEIVMIRDDTIVARTLSDEDGRFTAAGLRAGVYQLQAANSVAAYRCWTANAAPPGAASEVLLVSGGPVERGQRPIGDLFFSNPVLMGVIIGAAIAIPVAIYNSRDAS